MTTMIVSLWDLLNFIKENYVSYDNLESGTLEDLNKQCSWALNEIQNLLPNEELTQGQLDELNSLNANFSIERMLINCEMLEWNPKDKDKYVEQIAKDINIVLDKVKNGSIEDCLADMSEIDEMIKTLQDYDLDIINNADYNKIQSAYNELKTCELEYYEQNQAELDPNQINKFLNEYDDWMSIINAEIANPGAYEENIQVLQYQLATVAMYNSFFDEITEDMDEIQILKLKWIENQYAELGNQVAYTYNNAVQDMLSDGQLSIEEAKIAQNLAESIHNIFPNAQLDNTIDLVVNGWQEGFELFDIIAGGVLSDEGRDAYAKLLKVNTSSYIGKKDAVSLLEQIIDDIEDILEDLGATGNGPDGFWKGGVNDDLKIRHLKRFLKVLELRKDFLEQQIANMEQYMESRVKVPIGNAQNTQSFR